MPARSPSYTARTQQAAYPDTGAYDPSREERPEDPPLQRAMLGERAAKVAYDSAELEGRSRGIYLGRARCVTVMFLGWHVNSCVYLYIP